MRKVPVWVVSVILVVGLASVAAAAAKRPYEGVTIRAMMEPHPASYALQSLVKEFEEKTGMKVVLEIVPYDHLTEKALLSFTSRKGDYDVVHDDAAFHAGGYVRAGYLEPLDAYLKNKKFDNSNLELNDFMPKFIEQLKYDGKLYGLPLYGESTFLMYRKDLFDQYGVKVPKTLDELREAAAKLTLDTNKDGTPEIYGITLRGRRGIHIVYTWTGFMWAFGGKYLDKDLKPVVNNPANIKATEFYVDLLTKYGPPGASNYGWEENRVAFEQGHAAMTIDATVNGALAEDKEKSKVAGKVGYAVFPKGPGESGASIAVHGLYLSKFSKHKDAAYEFIKWATSKKVQLESLNVDPHCGITRRSVLQSSAFADKFGPFKDAIIGSIEDGNIQYVPRLGETFELTSRVGVALSEALAGVKSPKQALDEANEDIYKMLKDAGYYKK